MLDIMGQGVEAPRSTYEEDLRTVTRPFPVELNRSVEGQAIWVVPDLIEDEDGYAGIKVDAYCAVYVAPLQFLDGQEYIYLCSCMEPTWEVLSGLDVGSSSPEDCIGQGEACRHSLAIAAILGTADPPSSPHPCSTLNSLDFNCPVQQLFDSGNGRKILMAVDSGVHPCDRLSTLGLVSNDNGQHYKCLTCRSYSCDHICTLWSFLEEDEEAAPHLASYSLHPTLGPSEYRGKAVDRPPIGFDDDHPSVSYQPIPKLLCSPVIKACSQGALKPNCSQYCSKGPPGSCRHCIPPTPPAGARCSCGSSWFLAPSDLGPATLSTMTETYDVNVFEFECSNPSCKNRIVYDGQV